MNKTNKTVPTTGKSSQEKGLDQKPGEFHLRDASVGSKNSIKVTSEEINQAINTQREGRLEVFEITENS